MTKIIKRFLGDDRGAALVEYGILVGLIAVVCIVAVQSLGQKISEVFSNIASVLPVLPPT